MIERREVLGFAALALVPGHVAGMKRRGIVADAYGIIGQMKTAPGKRDLVVSAMAKGTRGMPGNLAYLIAEDLTDPDSIWITEVWESRAAHAASLDLPSVREAIGIAREHIVGFGTRVETRPVGHDG